MKKLSLISVFKTILMVLVLVIFFQTEKATAQTKNLEWSVWQLQNPGLTSSCEVLSFNINNGFASSTLDFSIGKSWMLTGAYKEAPCNVTLKINGLTYNYSLIWINTNKLILLRDGIVYVYAKSGSREDGYYKNYSKIFGQNIFKFEGFEYTNDSTKLLCHKCYGTGNCVFCSGSGIYPSGHLDKCYICLGTGRCFHCSGTGVK